MAVGNEIVTSANPRGVFMEGYVNAALKPGVVVQLDVSEGVGPDGRYDWEAYNPVSVAQSGAQRLIAVLMPDQLKGKLATDAYVSGDRCFIYVPIAGETLNMLVLDISGTADDIAFGDRFMLEDGSGKLLATAGTPESEPFVALEAITDPTADTLLHVMYTGH